MDEEKFVESLSKEELLKYMECIEIALEDGKEEDDYEEGDNI